jgi:hypothetical protein
MKQLKNGSRTALPDFVFDALKNPRSRYGNVTLRNPLPPLLTALEKTSTRLLFVFIAATVERHGARSLRWLAQFRLGCSTINSAVSGL